QYSRPCALSVYRSLYCASCRLVVFFFSIRRRPRRPPLFPYTTLFRSFIDVFEDAARHVRGNVGFLVQGTLYPDEIESAPRRGGLDRKSTRLNSSHVSISYAVFCLKKTNKSSTWTRLVRNVAVSSFTCR